MTQKLLPFILIIISIALLIPGVTQPMLTITGTMDKQQIKDTGVHVLAESIVNPKDDPQTQQASIDRVKQMIKGAMWMMGIRDVEGEVQAYQKTRSISGTIYDLYQSNNQIVAFLVALFSIVIPSIKLLLSLIIVLFDKVTWRAHMITLNSLLSKWSMADVFVVALIITYMAANATSTPSPAGGDLLVFNSQFEVGFYYFLAYCIFAILAAQIIQHSLAKTRAATENVTINQQPAIETIKK